MSEHESSLSDAVIEAAINRRASGHADSALLREIVATAESTKQSRRWLVPSMDHRRQLLLIAAVTSVLIIVVVAATSTGGRPIAPPSPVASLPAAIIQPSASPSAIPSTETCATDTISVLTGNAMPPAGAEPMTVPAGVLDIGVYLTAPVESGPGPQTDVWAIRAGEATRIAAIVGPDYNYAQVDDISADGREAIVSVGVQHIALPGPSCGDLYMLRTDGSGVMRLTNDGPDQFASNGVFSYDGRYVAFVHGETFAASPAIGLVDLRGDVDPQLTLCDIASADLHIAWSPLDDRLAAACGATLVVMTVDPSTGQHVGGVDGFVTPTADNIPINVGWLDPDRIVITSAVPGEQSNRPIQLDTITLAGRAAGTWSDTVVSKPTLTDPGLTESGMAIAPDGSAVAMYGDPTPVDPQGDTLGLYVIDTSTGVARRAAPWPVDAPGWSSDGTSIIYVEPSEPVPFLTVIDLPSMERHRYGSMPAEYDGGVWRGS